MNHPGSVRERNGAGGGGPRMGWFARRILSVLGAAGCLGVGATAVIAAGSGDAGVPGAPPEVSEHSPVALRPGVPAVLTLRGKGLGAVRSIWTSWGGFFERRDAEGWDCGDEVARVPAAVPAGFPAGLEAVRLVGANGVSNPVWVLVDGLAAVDIREAEGALLEPPVAVDGTFRDRGSRTFRVGMNAGQALSMEVVAQRLGSPTDPVLRVLDGAGRELAYAHDTVGLGTDVALEFLAPASGEYRVEVRDSEHGGGRAHRFRFRLGTFPVGVVAVEGAVGVAAGLEGQPSRVGWESAVSSRSGEARVEAGCGGADVAWGRMRLAGVEGGVVLMPRVHRVAGVVGREAEPNDGRGQATALGSGRVLAGGFDREGDVDWYRFEAGGAGAWTVRVRSRGLGWAGDPLVRVMDEAGRVLARSTGSDRDQDPDGDPELTPRLERAGAHYVEVTEAGRRAGIGRGYVIGVEPGAAGYRLGSETDRIHVPIGGKVAWKVAVERKGYDGPIRIEATGLPDGFQVENGLVEAGKKEWEVIVRCRGGVSAGTAAAVRWVGRAETAEKAEKAEKEAMVVPVGLAAAQRKAFPRMLYVPPGLMDAVWVAAVPPASE